MLIDILGPQATALTEGRRSSAFNHCKAVAESLQGLSWVVYTGPSSGAHQRSSRQHHACTGKTAQRCRTAADACQSTCGLLTETGSTAGNLCNVEVCNEDQLVLAVAGERLAVTICVLLELQG